MIKSMPIPFILCNKAIKRCQYRRETLSRYYPLLFDWTCAGLYAIRLDKSYPNMGIISKDTRDFPALEEMVTNGYDGFAIQSKELRQWHGNRCLRKNAFMS